MCADLYVYAASQVTVACFDWCHCYVQSVAVWSRIVLSTVSWSGQGLVSLLCTVWACLISYCFVYSVLRWTWIGVTVMYNLCLFDLLEFCLQCLGLDMDWCNCYAQSVPVWSVSVLSTVSWCGHGLVSLLCTVCAYFISRCFVCSVLGWTWPILILMR